MVFEVLADRFFSHVVKGPEVHHCWLWCGAVGDDGVWQVLGERPSHG